MTSTDHSTYISRRPSWASDTRLDPESVMHLWTAPTVAEGADTDNGEPYGIKVEIMQVDDLFVMPDGVTVEPGEPVIFLLDANIKSPQEGRRLAQAIVEACERWESATD